MFSRVPSITSDGDCLFSSTGLCRLHWKPDDESSMCSFQGPLLYDFYFVYGLIIELHKDNSFTYFFILKDLPYKYDSTNKIKSTIEPIRIKN